MGRPVADVTTVVYVPRTKMWEAQSMDMPGVRAQGEIAAAAVMRLSEGILVGAAYADEVRALEAWVKAEKKRLGLRG